MKIYTENLTDPSYSGQILDSKDKSKGIIWKSEPIPILDWRVYTSFKGYNPDWLEIKVLSTDRFSTPAAFSLIFLLVSSEIVLSSFPNQSIQPSFL